MPEIIIKSPNAEFVIKFDRTADACWLVVEWNKRYRSLEYAMAEIAAHILKTEF